MPALSVLLELARPLMFGNTMSLSHCLYTRLSTNPNQAAAGFHDPSPFPVFHLTAFRDDFQLFSCSHLCFSACFIADTPIQYVSSAAAVQIPDNRRSWLSGMAFVRLCAYMVSRFTRMRAIFGVTRSSRRSSMQLAIQSLQPVL